MRGLWLRTLRVWRERLASTVPALAPRLDATVELPSEVIDLASGRWAIGRRDRAVRW